MCRMSWKSRSLNLLEPSGLHQACYGNHLPFYNLNWLVSVTRMAKVYCAVRRGLLEKHYVPSLHPTMCLSASYFEAFTTRILCYLHRDNTNQRNAQFYKLMFNFFCLVHDSNLAGSPQGDSCVSAYTTVFLRWTREAVRYVLHVSVCPPDCSHRWM